MRFKKVEALSKNTLHTILHILNIVLYSLYYENNNNNNSINERLNVTLFKCSII